MSARAEGFAAIPNWMIRDESISPYAIAVYGALASHTGPGGIHPSQPTIAREAKCSERKVRDALVELEALGVVERVRRKNTRGRAANGYVLLPHGRLADDEEVAAPDAGTSAEVPAHSDGGSGTSEHSTPSIEEEPIEEEVSATSVARRGDVDRLLDLLDAGIIANGGKAPSRSKKNVSAMRLLLEKDGRSVEQVERAIEWSQGHEFWRSNILSASKLREQYDRMRLQAARAQGAGSRPPAVRAGVDLVQRIREREERARHEQGAIGA